MTTDEGASMNAEPCLAARREHEMALRSVWDVVARSSSDVAGHFERIIQAFYAMLLQPGDVVIDGGAHSGLHTSQLARLVGPSGKVLAFEPLPDVADRLERACALNGLSWVEVRRQALAERPGEATFFAVESEKQLSGLHKRDLGKELNESYRELSVETTTVDAAAATSLHRGPIRFVKLDLEGGEYRAICGGLNTLRDHRPILVFENALAFSVGSDSYSREDFFHLFSGHEYSLHDVLGCDVPVARWDRPGPFYFVAIPRAATSQVLPLLWLAVLRCLVPFVWPEREPENLPEAGALYSRLRTPSPFVGYLEAVEKHLRVTGWVGDPASGRIPRSVLVVCDGRTVLRTPVDVYRHDVAEALFPAALSRAGFACCVRVPVASKVEAFAELEDGSVAAITPLFWP